MRLEDQSDENLLLYLYMGFQHHSMMLNCRVTMGGCLNNIYICINTIDWNIDGLLWISFHDHDGHWWTTCCPHNDHINPHQTTITQ